MNILSSHLWARKVVFTFHVCSKSFYSVKIFHYNCRRFIMQYSTTWTAKFTRPSVHFAQRERIHSAGRFLKTAVKYHVTVRSNVHLSFMLLARRRPVYLHKLGFCYGASFFLSACEGLLVRTSGLYIFSGFCSRIYIVMLI